MQMSLSRDTALMDASDNKEMLEAMDEAIPATEFLSKI